MPFGIAYDWPRPLALPKALVSFVIVDGSNINYYLRAAVAYADRHARCDVRGRELDLHMSYLLKRFSGCKVALRRPHDPVATVITRGLPPSLRKLPKLVCFQRCGAYRRKACALSVTKRHAFGRGQYDSQDRNLTSNASPVADYAAHATLTTSELIASSATTSCFRAVVLQPRLTAETILHCKAA